jgi:hypothetical protein
MVCDNATTERRKRQTHLGGVCEGLNRMAGTSNKVLAVKREKSAFPFFSDPFFRSFHPYLKNQLPLMSHAYCFCFELMHF